MNLEEEQMAVLRSRLKRAEGLLEEVLPIVEHDEEVRAEAWPEEVERGDLVLIMADRIRDFLRK